MIAAISAHRQPLACAFPIVRVAQGALATDRRLEFGADCIVAEQIQFALAGRLHPERVCAFEERYFRRHDAVSCDATCMPS